MTSTSTIQAGTSSNKFSSVAPSRVVIPTYPSWLSDFRIWVVELRRGDGCGGRDTGQWRRRGGDVQAVALAGAR